MELLLLMFGMLVQEHLLVCIKMIKWILSIVFICVHKVSWAHIDKYVIVVASLAWPNEQYALTEEVKGYWRILYNWSIWMRLIPGFFNPRNRWPRWLFHFWGWLTSSKIINCMIYKIECTHIYYMYSCRVGVYNKWLLCFIWIGLQRLI